MNGDRYGDYSQRSVTHHVWGDEGMYVSDERGNTWLHRTCADGREDALIVFLRQTQNLNLNVANKDGETPLTLAIRNGRQKTVEILLAAGAKIDTRAVYGRTPLHTAAEVGIGPIIRLLVKHGADIEIQSETGGTPLHFAAEAQAAEAVETLIDLGANVNALDNNLNQPIHMAAAHPENLKGRIDSMEIMIKNGADVNQPNKFDNYPIIMFLRALCVMKIGETFLETSVAKKILATLLDNGANIQVRDSNKETPLHIACSYGEEELIRMLLAKKADPNVKDKSDETPMYKFILPHAARAYKDFKEILSITKLLVEEYNAKIDPKSYDCYKSIERQDKEYNKKNSDRQELMNFVNEYHKGCVVS